MIDPDSVRVDLLRVKRKIYEMYPEGSEERKSFVILSKLSEMGYLMNLVPPKEIARITDQYKAELRSELKSVFYKFMWGGGISIWFFIAHLDFPNSLLFCFWWVGLVVAFIDSLRNGFSALKIAKKMNPFFNEYKVVQNRIQEITKDLKDFK